MTSTQADQDLEARIQAMYDGVHSSIREDTVEAAIWARKMLTEHEGKGHELQITAHCELRDGAFVYTNSVQCSFAKPEWSGDHCGQPMETGAEAIVRAVCEYLCGG